MTISSSEAVVAGVRSPVLHSGPQESSEAVVFVHGNPGPADDWSDLLERVGEFTRAIAPEMPGYGAADKPKEFDYTVGGYARHLAGLLDQLRVERVHLVMHDFGGPWGLRWAADHPDAFASATLINTGVMIDYKWHTFARIWRTPVLGELFMATSSRRGVRLLVGRQNPKLSQAQLDRLYDALKGWPAKRAVLKLYRATPPSALAAAAPAFRALDRPTLVIWGTDDAYLPREQAELQRQSFPSATVHELEGNGHWVMYEDPERVASLVVPFLREQVGAHARH